MVRRFSIMRKAARMTLMLGLALSINACTLRPLPISDEERQAQVAQDLKEIFAEQSEAPVSGRINLYEAMARAVKFNLDHRLKLMEEALSRKSSGISHLDMLPSLVASAGYDGRSNLDASNSKSLATNASTQAHSTSAERTHATADLRLSWNILDFGVSYARAKQYIDRDLIAGERRRKVIHNIIQDTRSAYWRAVSAQRLMERITPLMERVEQALNDARDIETQRLQAPMQALTYRRTLLDIMRQLKLLQRNLVAARIQLATLMNLPVGQPYELDMPVDQAYEMPQLDVKVKDLEMKALMTRPELKEEAYQARISSLETRKALLRLLPGIELNWGYDYDDNKFLHEGHWWSYSSRITMNLMNIASAPARISQAKAQEKVVKLRRLALNMAVMSQVHVAWARLSQAEEELTTHKEMREVESRIHQQIQARRDTRREGALSSIRSALNLVLAELRLDMAYGDVQNALGRLQVSVGHDPLPDKVVSHDLATLADAIRHKMERPITADIWTTTEPDTLSKSRSKVDDISLSASENSEDPVSVEPAVDAVQSAPEIIATAQAEIVTKPEIKAPEADALVADATIPTPSEVSPRRHASDASLIRAQAAQEDPKNSKALYWLQRRLQSTMKGGE
ncbi:MAG: TolC family protein [Magnetococcales bacterium]|nr:TolC family protein [Magnetococcales bacterium]